MAKYDDASWHYEGEYPDEQPEEGGATRIGLFLAWAIRRGLLSELHRHQRPEAVAAVTARALTGAEFLLRECDEELTDEDLNAEGNRFAVWHYEDRYLEDYAELFADDDGVETLYHVQDTWESYDRLERVLDRRFSEWRQGL